VPVSGFFPNVGVSVLVSAVVTAVFAAFVLLGIRRLRSIRTAAIASALVYGLAEMPGRPASRQTRAQVEKLLEDTKLDQQMKLFGQWDDWKNGRRGVF